MEEFGKIFGIIIAAIAIIYNSKSKKTKSGEKQPSTSDGETWTADNKYTEMRTDTLQPNDSQFSIQTPQPSQVATTSTCRRTTNKHNNPKQDGIISLTSSHGQTNMETESPKTEEEFDLRQAVIYSEILKPKFEE